MSDSLFRGSMNDIDPDVYELTQIEAERQYRRLILIPSESSSPWAVREALSTAFHNIYAEGYPDEHSRRFTEEEILDYDARLGYYRRYSDPRYYKGVEYANVVETLARRRAAETFADNGVKPEEIFVNVQALSGGPANNAVYHALVKPGDTVMGMDLLHGGHLSHGSPVNRSGKYYNIVHYTIDNETEQINYDDVEALALEHKPKMIIIGFSSYSWKADWQRMKDIADKVGAYLLADMSHVAGLIAGKVYPSPIGIADIVTTTTHKTLCGPRGALIMTTSKKLARKIDRAVFPGEQGGPHVNVFAALAIALKIAQSKEFSQLQSQIIKNCLAFTNRFVERGFKIPFGGTDSHLMNLNTKTITGPDGTTLSGDMASRILDLAGIVVNRNTIPGDRSPLNPNGVRMGTPWITQRGFDENDCIKLADIIADLLEASTPYKQKSSSGLNRRAKINFEILENARIKVRDMAEKAGIDYEASKHGYPHFFYLDDKAKTDKERVAFEVKDDKIEQFFNMVASSDVGALKDGDSQATQIHTPKGDVLGMLTKVNSDHFRLSVSAEQAGLTAAWLRDLGDGFVQADEDLFRKLTGPISMVESTEEAVAQSDEDPIWNEKPYYVGVGEGKGEALPEFKWEEPKDIEPRKTALNETHRDMGAKMIDFGGWDMPVWYGSVSEEHLACREAAGLFDATHMGVYQAEGPSALVFLEGVCGNNISTLKIGQSLYTHFLTPDGDVIDDLLVYRRGEDKYLVVVNASNDDKDWAWLNAVKNGEVMIDRARPWAKAYGREVVLRNLRDPKEGKDMRVDVPLQGPKSREILLALGCDDETRARVMKLKRTELCDATIGGFDLIVSRTGYTGEKMAFELFVHPDESPKLWQALVEVGEPMGMKACGLGARDSLRTEAGLPLYGQEMGGEMNLSVGDANFRTYVKTYKPWFIGRQGFLDREAKRKSKVIRFRFNEKGVRMAHLGDPITDKRGKTVGVVTSCAADKDGFLTGQAYVDFKNAKKGTNLLIFPHASSDAVAPADLQPGDRMTVPNPATVLSRFPKL